MGSFSDYLENKLLDHVFGNTAYTAAATLYAALSTADPTDSGGGIAEPVGNAYARVAITNNTTNWPNASAGSKANGTAVTFPTASGSWGTITHFAIFDASSSGNMIGYGTLTASKVIGNGDTASFAISALTITLD